MKFSQQKIEGVYLIVPEPFTDERGLLRRHFCKKEFENAGINNEVRQCNISENKLKYTLRGFHYQKPPYGEDKTISCINGSIFDIVIDLRKESKTYLKWESYNLNKENRLSLFVPKGCANAYMTLENDSWIFYYHSEFYSPGHEGGIRFDDPFFNIEWPEIPKMISHKDNTLPDFNPNLL